MLSFFTPFFSVCIDLSAVDIFVAVITDFTNPIFLQFNASPGTSALTSSCVYTEVQ